MKAVILAAGVGQRLSGLLDNIPKPMAQVAGKPILQHNIEWLRSFGVTDIYINLHHLPNVITHRFGDGAGWKVNITYSHEKTLLGTAGAVKKIARECWNNTLTDSFLVIYGDNLLSNFDLNQIISFHNRKAGLAMICLYRNPQQLAKSGVAVIDENCRIIKFVEKPSPGQISGDLINTGIYVLSPAILDYIPQDHCCDFAKDVFTKALDDNNSLYGMVSKSDLVAIDTPQLFKKHVITRIPE